MKKVVWLDKNISDTIMDLDVAIVMLRVIESSNFVLTAINSATKRLLKTDEDPIGRSILEFKFASAAILQELQRFAEDCVSDKSAKSFERFVTLRSGEELWTSYSVIPILEEEEVVAFMVTLRDVTELIALRREKQRKFTEIANRFFRVCAWCGSVGNEDGAWQPIAEYVERFPSHDLLSRVCPDCLGS